jgi:antitoxin (DNA-binding transcriptional repressor) of toxin-antitoxin stability system
MNDDINPLLDDCFKTVFAGPPWARRNKGGILDIRVQTASKMEIDVEVQISKSPVMAKRVLYYLSKMIGEQLKPGDSYGLLRPVIGVVICDHRMLEEEPGYAHSYTLRERDSGREFTDMVKVLILELPKVPPESDGTPVWPWLKYFNCRKVQEFEILLYYNRVVRKLQFTNNNRIFRSFYMKFVSVRDFRTASAAIWKTLPEEQEMVITNKGKPIALLTPLNDKTLEDTLSAVRRAKAINAAKLIQQQSIKDGLDKITLEEINAEIEMSRKERKRYSIL